MAREIYYKSEGEWKGPVNNDQLISLAKMGIIAPDTQLQVGSKKVLAKQVKQLVPVFENAETAGEPPKEEEPVLPPIIPEEEAPSDFAAPPIYESEPAEDSEFASFSETASESANEPAPPRPKQKRLVDGAAFRKDSNDAFTILRLFYTILKWIAIVNVNLTALAVVVLTVILCFGELNGTFDYYNVYNILPLGVFGKLNIVLFCGSVVTLWIMMIGVMNTFLKNLFSETGKTVKKVNLRTFFKIGLPAAAFGLLVIGIGIAIAPGNYLPGNYALRTLLGLLCAAANGLFFSLWALNLRVCFQNTPFSWKKLVERITDTKPIFAAVFGLIGVISGFFLSFRLHCFSMIGLIGAVLISLVAICFYIIFTILPIKMWYSIFRSFLWSHAAAVETDEMLERWEENREK